MPAIVSSKARLVQHTGELMSEDNQIGQPVDNAILSATRLAIFEIVGLNKTLLGVVETVRDPHGAWTLRCSAPTEALLEKMRAPIEAYATTWRGQHPEDPPTTSSPDLMALATVIRQTHLSVEIEPTSDYSPSLQLDLKTGDLVVIAATTGTPSSNMDDGSLRKWIDRIKETISLSKDFLDVVIKMSPLGLVPPAIMLWVYLRRIGWNELILESLGSASGLITLLACTLIFMLVLMLQFCFPSLLIAPLSGLLDQEKGNLRIRLPLTLLCLGLPIAWTVVYSISVLCLPDIGLMSVGLATLISLLFDVLVVLLWLKSRMNVSDWWRLFLIGMWSLFGAVCSTFPFLLLIQAVEKQPFSNVHPILVLLGCAIVSVAGLFPGYIKIASDLSSQKPGKTAVITLGAIIGVTYLVGDLVLMIAPVSAYVLAASGVYSQDAGVYQLRKPELAHAFRAAHMSVFSTPKDAKVPEPQGQFVGAFMRYNFGGSKLLCKYPFDPSVLMQKAEIDKARHLKLYEPYLNPSDDCVPVKADDLTPIHVG